MNTAPRTWLKYSSTRASKPRVHLHPSCYYSSVHLGGTPPNLFLWRFSCKGLMSRGITTFSALRACSPSANQESERTQRAPTGGPVRHSPLPRHLVWCLPVGDCLFHLRQDSQDKETKQKEKLPALPLPLPAAEFGCGSPCTGWLSELAARCLAEPLRSRHTYNGDNQR